MCMYERCQVVYRCVCVPVQAGWCGLDGWYRVGIPGGYYGHLGPTDHALLEERPAPAKRARRPCRGRSGGCRGRAYRDGGGDGHSPPCGPGRHPAGTSLGMTSECRLTANKARIHDILLKVSQNRNVSPKYVEKACHSPHIQNGLGKSPLEILGFPLSPAFSHKELLGHFDASRVFIVKMTKCRPSVHPRDLRNMTRRGRSDTPTVAAASCSWQPLLI